jgi:thiamine biosynthesis lipoprotein
MTRARIMMVWVTALLLNASAPSPGRAPEAGEPRVVAFRAFTMGTWGSVTIVTADSASVADAAFAALHAFHRVDSLMSNWTETSEVSRINREAAGGRAIAANPEVVRVVDFAERVARESGGAFDATVEPLVRAWGFLGGTPRVPSQEEIDDALARVGHQKVHVDTTAGTVRLDDGVRVDLGGVAKGYGVDEAAEELRRAGVADALVDLSGNMAAIGNAPGHEGWTVGIRDPAGAVPYLARLRLRGECVATSGDYEQFVDKDGKRYGHILDPRTGYSARGLSSVTVVARDAMACDAWATALFVLGPELARELAQARDDLSVVLIEPHADGTATVWVEESLMPRFQLVDEAKPTLTVRSF